MSDISQQGGNPLFDFLAKLDLTLGSVRQQSAETVRALNRSEEASKAEVPRFITFHGNCMTNGAGFGVMVLDLNGPDQGHFWYVRKLAVFGPNPDPTVAVAGRVDIFSSAGSMRGAQSLAQFGLQDWQDFSASLPIIGTYGGGELVLRHNEELAVVISGAAAQVQYNCVGRCEDYQESSSRQTWMM